MELAIAAGLISGLIAGIIIGKAFTSKSAQKMVLRIESEMVDKMEIHEKEKRAWEEEKASFSADLDQELQTLKKSAEVCSKQLEKEKKDLRCLKRWGDGLCRELFEELNEAWNAAKLPDTYHKLPREFEEKRLLPIRQLAEKLQSWSEKLPWQTPEALYTIGLWHALEGRTREANTMFHSAASKGLGVKAWLAVGDTYWDIKKEDKARDAYSHCLRAPDQPDHIFIRLARVAVSKRDHDDALIALEHILNRKKNPQEVYNLAGYAYGMLLEDEKAIDVLTRGLKQYPDSPDLRAKMIIPFARMGSWDDAEDAYKNALDLDPNFSEAPFSMGVAWMHHGEDKKAITHFNRALSMNEHHPESLFCLGVIQNRKQKYKNALGYFQKAVEIKPDYAEAYYNMKESYEGLKDFDKAIAVLKKATRLNPAFK